MNNRRLIIILYLSFLSACSTTNNTATFTPLEAEADQAIVYLYRPAGMSNALYTPGINFNGEFKLYAKNGVNSRFSLKPGVYLFEFQAENKYSELTPLSIDLKAGNLYYIRIDTSLGIANTSSYEPYNRSFKLTRMDELKAVKEIAACCIANNKSATKEDTKLDEKNQHGGFSVDKTQNPFSH